MCKGDERCSIQGWGGILHVCNAGYEGEYCICGKYGKPIHINGQFTALGGRETHHEIIKGHFGVQFILQRQGYFLRGFCDMDWVGDTNDRRSIMGYVFLVDIGIIL